MLQLKFVVVCGLLTETISSINITSPRVTNWGHWGNFERCPFGTFAQGFQLKMEGYLYVEGDDTALNSIKLFCGHPSKQNTTVITSTEGPYGTWGEILSCYPGFLSGFQLRVVPTVTGCVDGDNMATTNVRFFCTNGELEGDGLKFGNWGQCQRCGRNQAICGIQTQVDPVQAKADDTALNNVVMECCDLGTKASGIGK